MTKVTSLFEEHKKLGAKIVDFAGWEMPLQYRGIIQEHEAVRKRAGLFDVSHMGEFLITGKDSAAFLNSIVPQDIEAIIENKVIYAQLTNDKAGIVDDLLIYKFSSDKFLLIVNASRLSIDWLWINAHKKDFDITIEDQSEFYSLLALQGPNACKILEKAGFPQSSQPEFMHFAIANVYGQGLFVSRTGYTGEDGFEILVKNEDAATLWNNLLQDGKEFGIEPIGLGARDTLRLEAALPLHGNDLDEETTPIEAGLKWSVSLDKKADYPGKSVILDQAKNGIKKKFIGFKLTDRGIARHGNPIFSNGKPVGHVSSGTISPTSRESIGLAYVSDLDLKIGSQFEIEIRGKKHSAQVVKRPFIVKAYAK